MPNNLREQALRAFLERMAGEMPAPVEAPPAAVRRARRSLARTVVVGMVAAGLAVAGALAGIGTLLTSRPQPADEDEPRAPVEEIAVRGNAVHVAVGEGYVWVAGNRVAKVDPATNRTVAAFGSTSRAEGSAIAVGEGAAWVSGGAFDGEVVRIDVATGEVLTIHAGSGYNDPYAVAVGAGSVWVTNDFDELNRAEGTLERIDSATRRDAVAATIPLSNPYGLAVLDERVWVVVANEADTESQLYGIDAGSGEVVATIDRDVDHEIAAGFGSLWATVSQGAEPQLLRLDPASGEAAAAVSIPHRGPGSLSAPLHVAIGDGAVWVALTDRNEHWERMVRVVEIDPASNTIAGEVSFRGQVADMALGEGAVWVVDGRGTLYRIDKGNFAPPDNGAS
jgi:hypothetical protein